MSSEASRNGKWPWWIWLVVILFPISLHSGWMLAVVSIAAFLIVMWAITRDLK